MSGTNGRLRPSVHPRTPLPFLKDLAKQHQLNWPGEEEEEEEEALLNTTSLAGQERGSDRVGSGRVGSGSGGRSGQVRYQDGGTECDEDDEQASVHE